MFKKINNKGIILITAYLVIVVAIILSVALIQRALSEFNQARRNKILTQGLYQAEAAIEQAAFTLGNLVANRQPVADTFNDTLSLSPDFNITFTWVVLDTDHTVLSAQGIATIIRHYHISGTATDIVSGLSVTAHQIVALKKTYTFQHAVFYNDDLEMLPGPNMTLSGKIHSNRDIYLGTHSTFTVDSDYLHGAGNVYNQRKDSSDYMEGAVRIRRENEATYRAMLESGDFQPLDSRRSDWTDESQVRWNGTVQSAVHGVTSLAVPNVGSISQDGFYAQNAGLKIVDTTAYNASGGVVSLPSGTINQSSVYNYREGKYVTLTDINMSLLNSSGAFPSNGLLYVTRTDASSVYPNGVRLLNGSQLQGALTLVSNDAIYVKGDYNSINKKPAAIICDSLDILSNNWNDANSHSALGSRIATSTTINAAFIGGIDTTTSGHYNGGLENYPRFLEDWTGKTLRIRGSFVELWNSQMSQGAWLYGNPQYTAPLRDWNYDTDFNDSSKLPPFTPYAVETERVAWWKS
jgi:type II secretory pathway pseudopilin PulG